jgi:hypothetical protein
VLPRLVVAAVLAAALLGAPQAALAHGGAKGYTATITSITPAVPGLELTVLDGDDRLRLRNLTGAEVVVLGYDGEPYLRFTEAGVEQNANSPAVYLNEDRYADVALPANADADAPPAWTRLSGRDDFEWHDHRIHWMSPQPPPAVRDDPDAPHRVFEWKVPLVVAGDAVAVAGTLDYAPPSDGVPSIAFLAVPLGALLLLGAVLAWTRLRQRRPRSRAD